MVIRAMPNTRTEFRLGPAREVFGVTRIIEELTIVQFGPALPELPILSIRWVFASNHR